VGIFTTVSQMTILDKTYSSYVDNCNPLILQKKQ